MNTLELTKIKLDQFGNLFHKEPAVLSDQELLSMDFILHRAWTFKRMGHYVRLGDKDWNDDDIITLHAKVRQEMSKRGFQHPIKDELDDQTQAFLRADGFPSVDSSAQPEFRFPIQPDTADNRRLENLLAEEVLSLDQVEKDEIDKGVRQAFGSYGGKRVLAHRIASYIPYHKTYVEPFAGGAAVFFAKNYSPQEILNDKDPEIAFVYRFIKEHTPEDRQALAKRDWLITKRTFERIRNMKPANERDRFYKNFYLTRASHHSSRIGTINPLRVGDRIDLTTVDNVHKRLQSVSIHNKDYLDILKQYDSPETFFYLDPPYPEKHNVFDFGFEEEEFLKALKGLEAMWILSYPAERMDLFKGYNVIRIKRRKQLKDTWSHQSWAMEILASNFPLKPVHLYIEKELGPNPGGMERRAPLFLPQLDEPESPEIQTDQTEAEKTEPQQFEIDAIETDSDNRSEAIEPTALEPVALEKIRGAFKSSGGKYRLFKKLIPLIPEHKTFVEGFCGGAQVFFHKKRSDEEILNDINPDLMFGYRFIKGMDQQDLNWLKDQRWTVSRAYARKLFDSRSTNPRQRFYRFMYLNKSLYWGEADNWSAPRRGEKGEGYKIRVVDRLPEIQERLQGVKLLSRDWKSVVKDFDSKDSFFYLDPPYPLHWPNGKGGVGSKTFNEEELVPTLKKMKGKFLMSYELEKQNIFKGLNRYRIKTAWSGARMLGFRPKYELLVSNYDLKPSDLYVEKSLIAEELSLSTALQ